MLTREQSIANFVSNMDELTTSNFILVDKKISILLKGVSCSKLFMELFNHCTENYDYLGQKSKCFIKGGAFGSGRCVMPTDGKDVIAFVFLLLFEIDSHRQDFISLLDAYFREENVGESFRRFAKEVLIPFKKEVVYAVNQLISQKPTFDTEKVSVTKVEKSVLPDDKADYIKALLNRSKAVILQYRMEDQLKAELLALYDDFSENLYGKSNYRIKMSFLGYKYSTLYHRKLDVSLGEIEKILKECGILDDYN